MNMKIAYKQLESRGKGYAEKRLLRKGQSPRSCWEQQSTQIVYADAAVGEQTERGRKLKKAYSVMKVQCKRELLYWQTI